MTKTEEEGKFEWGENELLLHMLSLRYVQESGSGAHQGVVNCSERFGNHQRIGELKLWERR